MHPARQETLAKSERVSAASRAPTSCYCATVHGTSTVQLPAAVMISGGVLKSMLTGMSVNRN
ncbi:hypothetical protein HMPREF9080_01015 [Cardiobacterium valvarum F0432]|uniref:Uncharacterized protein n=1 Tax=Cardiobacterium valvarum F0432 TaxID=797473 RepID=G9ZE31_9GAMM|nr:hypothetical protein HMPREF9080_01015 [Cardiobacterium valvarum F0432]